jgi:hypothetical protein
MLAQICAKRLERPLAMAWVYGELRRHRIGRCARADRERAELDQLGGGVGDHLRAKEPLSGRGEHEFQVATDMPRAEVTLFSPRRPPDDVISEDPLHDRNRSS